MSSSPKSQYRWLGFSVKSMLLILTGIIALGLYVGVLIFGENSLVVLNKLHSDKDRLLSERKQLKVANQNLQKEYFELLQLSE